MTLAWSLVIVASLVNVGAAGINVQFARQNRELAWQNKQNAKWLADLLEEITTNRTRSNDA